MWTCPVITFGANYGPRTLAGEPWRLFTSTFLHIGIFHFLFNMNALWDAGKVVERMVGNVGLAILYILSGICGSIVSLLWGPIGVSAGASGAIFGIFGAIIGSIVFRPGMVPTAVRRDLRSSSLFFVAFNLIYGLTTPGIDIAAHFGGFATGLVCGMILGADLKKVTDQSRAIRNVSIVVLGSVVVNFGYMAIPQDPPDVLELREMVIELHAFQEAMTIVGKFSEIMQKPDDPSGAETIEKDLLPQFTRAMERMELKGLRDPSLPKSRICDYLSTQKEIMELYVRGCREKSPRWMIEVVKRQMDALQKLEVIIELRGNLKIIPPPPK